MAKPEIEPRILKGFQDTLPQVALTRKAMIRTIEDVYSSFGFAPIDTPALEYAEILLGKGSAETDKQTYRFPDLGGRDIALRFDLTVPLARFVAMHINELGVPFKRFHIAPVWRAEKPQRGRYREFIQCDFDTIGSDSILADAETLLVAHRTMTKLEIGHTLRVNNRLVLNGLLDSLDAADRSVLILRAIDKLDKLGEEAVRQELSDAGGLTAEKIDSIFRYLSFNGAGNTEILAGLTDLLKNSERGALGVSNLRELLSALNDSGVPEGTVSIDVSIARGLDYYTGTVFETRMTDLPGIGSICSGGRYDNLAGLYTKRRLPGVGGSIGLDRIMGAYEELGRFTPRASNAQVLMTLMDEHSRSASLRLAMSLREGGFLVDTYPEVGGLGNQLKYGNRKGIPVAIILGENEVARGVCAVKDLITGEQQSDVPLATVNSVVGGILSR